jgi:aminobenzoyl-glutamate transport protein
MLDIARTKKLVDQCLPAFGSCASCCRASRTRRPGRSARRNSTSFLSLGRHPLAGLAAAFSGVAAVFGVNFLIVPIDPILTEITNDAIHLLNPTHSIDLMASFYFSVVSSLVLIVVCTVITERVVEPRLGPYRGETPADSGKDVSAEEARG